MIESLKIIEEFLLTQMDFYTMSFKEERKYKYILTKISELRKELENETFSKLDDR